MITFLSFAFALTTIYAIPLPSSDSAQSCVSHHENDQLVSTVSHLGNQWSKLVGALSEGVSDSNIDNLNGVLSEISVQVNEINSNFSDKRCVATGVKSDQLTKHTTSLLDEIESHSTLFSSVLALKDKAKVRYAVEGSTSAVVVPTGIPSHSSIGTSHNVSHKGDVGSPGFKGEVHNNVNTGGYTYQGGDVSSQPSDNTGYNENSANGQPLAAQQYYGNQYPYQAHPGYSPYQSSYYYYYYPSGYQYPAYQPQPAAQEPQAPYVPRVGGGNNPGYPGGGYGGGYPQGGTQQEPPVGYQPAYYPTPAAPPIATSTPTGYHGGLISRTVQFGHRLVEVLIKQVEDIGIIFVISDDQNGSSKANDTKHKLLSSAHDLS